MAPPIIITSALSKRESITIILSLTFAPPKITVNGRSGEAVFSALETQVLSQSSILKP